MLPDADRSFTEVFEMRSGDNLEVTVTDLVRNGWSIIRLGEAQVELASEDGTRVDVGYTG